MVVGYDFYAYGYYLILFPARLFHSLARPRVRFKERRGNLERRGGGKVNTEGIH